MKPISHVLTLPGSMLQRGFWLYVWRVTDESGREWLYVGRTGDSSSANAQSPFTRMGQHLGPNPKSNALRRNLTKAGVNVDRCGEFTLLAVGPLFPEATDMASHRPIRDRMSGLEKGLCDAFHRTGYNVLNKVSSSQSVDQPLLREVLQALNSAYPRLELGS